MSRSLIKDSTIYGLGSIIMRAAGFLLIPLYTRFLSVDEYGALSLLNLMLRLVSFVCLLGVSSAAVRFYFDSGADGSSRQRVYGTAMTLLLIIPALVLVPAIPLARELSQEYLPSIEFFPFIFVIMLIGLFAPLIQLMNGLLRATRRPIPFVVFNVSFFLCQAATIIVAVAFLGYGLQGQVYAQLLTNALFAGAAFFVLWQFTRPAASLPDAQRMLAFGIPLVPYFVFMWLNQAAGRFFLERDADLATVGIFALALQFGGVVNLLSTATDNALLPHFLSRADREDAEQELGKLSFRYFAFFGLLCLAVIAVAGPLIRFMATEDYHRAVLYVAPIAAVNWLFVAYRPVVWSLNYGNRTGVLSTIQGSSTVVLIVALAIFINLLDLGISGVIYAMLLTNSYALIVGHAIARRSIRLQIPWARLSLTVTLLVAGGTVLHFLGQADTGFVSLAASGGTLLVLALLVARLAGIRSVRQVFRPDEARSG